MPAKTHKKLLTYLKKAPAIKKGTTGAGFDKDELFLEVKPEELPSVVLFLRDDSECMFKILIDLCGVDYPEDEQRFEVVYQFLSMAHNLRIRLRVPVAEGEAVPSLSDIYSTSVWFERETWDMYGIPFDGNPDLRRLLTDYGFKGHPLRKDFPLTGYVEMRYDEDQKRVIYEPVQLKQDFRKFDFVSPWEGMTNVQLPGDEKAVKPFGAELLEQDEDDREAS